MITVVGFVLAAAAASLARAEAGRRWNRSDGWPGGTFVVNVVGSFLLGVLHDLHPPVSTVIAVGGLGALTTFSSFSRDAMTLVEQRRFAQAVAYIGATTVLCVGGAALGMAFS